MTQVIDERTTQVERPAAPEPMPPPVPAHTAGPRRRQDRDPWPWHLGIIGAFLLLGIVATWPLVLHFTTAVPGFDLGNTRFALVDQDVILWTQWWVFDSVFHHHASPFVTDLLYWPYYRDGLSTLLVDLQTWRAIITAPVQATLGLIAAYNTGILISFAFGGWGAWLLAREAGAGRAAAFLAGMVYVVGPYHLSQLNTEVAVVSIEALPFAVLWSWRAVRGTGWPSIALAAACIVIANLLNWYYGAHGILALVLIALIVAWQRRRHGWRAVLPVAGRALAVIALYAVLFSPVLVPMLMQVARATTARDTIGAQGFGAQNGTYASYNQLFVTDLAIRAASMHPNSFLSPNKDTRLTPPQWAGTAYFGVTTLILALAALIGGWGLGVGGWRRRARDQGSNARDQGSGIRDQGSNRGEQGLDNLTDDPKSPIPNPQSPTPNPQPLTPILWGWVFFGLVYLVLALGPDLHDLNGVPVRTDIPLLRTIDRGDFVPLPYALLMRLPGMDLFRVPGRAAVMVTLAVAVLAALGAERITGWGAALWRRLRGNTTGVALRLPYAAIVPALATGLMLGEYLTIPLPLYTPQTPAFYAQLGQDPAQYGILELPITVHMTNDHRRMYNQTIHDKGISGGYLSRPIPDPYRQPDSPFAQFTELYTTTEILEQDCDAATRALLALNDFRYLVAYKERRDYNTGTGNAAWDWPLGPVIYEDPQIRAYAVGQPDLTHTWLYLGASWSPGERAPDGAPRRWLLDGVGMVRIWSPGGVGHLLLTVESATGQRPLTVQLDEAALLGLTAVPAPQQVRTPRLALARGWYTLRISDNGPPPPHADDRTVGVSHIRWIDEAP